jgi:hypothetical protein
MMEIEEQNKIDFEECGKKVQDFTTVLNKYNLEYTVRMWADGEGYSIDIDDCSIEFAMAGAISFKVNVNIDDTKEAEA